MTRIIAITNQKGGVGKTTTTVNLSASLAATRRKVLLVDLDPQGNATMGSGIDKNNVEWSGYHALMGEVSLRDAMLFSEDAGFHILPGNSDLTAAEVELIQVDDRQARLTHLLQEVAGEFDYILIDCPPSLNLLTLNALTAADSVFIPIQCEYYALEGLSALLETVQQIQASINPTLQIEGLLRTMFDARNNLANQVAEQLLEHFGDKVYRTIIPRNVRLAEAPSYGLPIIKYDKTSRGAIAYLALAAELVRREQESQQPEIKRVEGNMMSAHPPAL
ncbi:MAG: ParA family protein [Gammaproteobacteria bacterium]